MARPETVMSPGEDPAREAWFPQPWLFTEGSGRRVSTQAQLDEDACLVCHIPPASSLQQLWPRTQWSKEPFPVTHVRELLIKRMMRPDATKRCQSRTPWCGGRAHHGQGKEGPLCHTWRLLAHPCPTQVFSVHSPRPPQMVHVVINRNSECLNV